MVTADRSYQDQPTYWFAILERAIERRDCAMAERARRELTRLGVEVRFTGDRKEAATK